MLRKLAKSVVVTTVALAAPACHKSPYDEVHWNPPPRGLEQDASVLATGATATTTEPNARPTAKRHRTKAAGHPAGDAVQLDWSTAHVINPKDAQGRAIMVAFDDTCYVETPMKPPIPPMPTGSRAVDIVPVDCPPAMDDPAWDDCLASSIYQPQTGGGGGPGDCVCAPTLGNPPPPPLKIACPKK